jgi:undecaprenyl phosphate-alpha-L-ara4N flippase subunit ArnF
MTQFAFGYGFAFFCAFIVIVADYVIKLAADAGHTVSSTYVFLGVALYGVAAVAWFFSMQHVTLVQAGVAYSMLSLIALAIMGVLWFDEPLRLREYAGLGCAMLAMVLLTRTA